MSPHFDFRTKLISCLDGLVACFDPDRTRNISRFPEMFNRFHDLPPMSATIAGCKPAQSTGGSGRQTRRERGVIAICKSASSDGQLAKAKGAMGQRPLETATQVEIQLRATNRSQRQRTINSQRPLARATHARRGFATLDAPPRHYTKSRSNFVQRTARKGRGPSIVNVRSKGLLTLVGGLQPPTLYQVEIQLRATNRSQRPRTINSQRPLERATHARRGFATLDAPPRHCTKSRSNSVQRTARKGRGLSRVNVRSKRLRTARRGFAAPGTVPG